MFAGDPVYTPPAGPVRLAYLDDHLVMADKPSGLLSVPGRGEAKRDCVEARLAQALGWVRAAHRLDMDTSGLLVLGRTPDCHRALSAMFASRSVHKTYEARVWGCPACESGEVDAPLVADWPNRPRQKIDRSLGKSAVTAWQRLGSDAQTSRIRLHPITGRSHQLRVHLASIGHPILGDPFYAPPVARHAAPRLMLHAAEMCLTHPVTRQALTVRSEPGF